MYLQHHVGNTQQVGPVLENVNTREFLVLALGTRRKRGKSIANVLPWK